MAGWKSLILKECVFHPTMFVPDGVREQFSKMTCVNSPKNPTKSSPSIFTLQLLGPRTIGVKNCRFLISAVKRAKPQRGYSSSKCSVGTVMVAPPILLEVHRFSEVPLELDRSGLIFSSRQGLASFTN